MKHFTIIITWILCAIIPFGIFAQQKNTLWFHSMASLNDFSQSYNAFVYHDSEGFVWISSTAGLNRYDGLSIKQYRSNPNDSSALFDENIQSQFFEDSRHDIWFTTFQAIHCYNRKNDNFKHYFVRNKKGQVLQEDYRAFFLEKDSFLWLVANDKLFRFNINNPDSEAEVDSFAPYRYIAEADENGNVKFIYSENSLGSDNKYLVIANGKIIQKEKWLHGINPLPTFINSILRENDTLVWLGTNRGLVLWNRQKNTFRHAQNLPRIDCYFVPHSDNELIVLMPEAGLLRFNKEEEVVSSWFVIRSIDGPDILPKNFRYIYLDHSDNLWISFLSNGLIFANLGKTKFRSLPKQFFSKENTTWNYTNFMEDSDGNIWHGTNLDGLYQLDAKGKLKKHFSHQKSNPSSLPYKSVQCLVQDDKDRIWVGTAIGFALFNPPNSFLPVYTDTTTSNLFFIHCYRLHSGELLATTVNKGVFLLKENNGKPYLKNVLLSKKGFTSIYQDSSNRIYICKNETEICVYQLKKGLLDSITTLPIRGGVNGFYENVDLKILWIATSNGLAKIDLTDLKKNPVMFTEKNGLSDKYITGVINDSNHNLWLSTAKGLVFYNWNSNIFKTFSLADGIQSSEFYLNAALKRRNGELWFGGSNGITVVPDKSIDNYIQTLPKLKITGIKINDEERPGLKDAETGATNVSQINRLDLPYDDNTLSFEFVAIEYSDPSNNQLQYMLEGEDDNWVELKKGELGFARYSKLHHGSYTFWIKGANSDGVWGDPVKALEITINPHWTNTWAFKISLVVLLGLISYGIFRYRISQIREKAELNTRVAENKMAALRSQMNPHFVFNSLQTVNGFITKQDLRGAIEYVNQFARLMRVILENSRVNVIPLDNEIELLELYLKIESRRFSQPFTYSITVGNDLDTFSTEIPPMLLQPFVENAIKHGLFHKKEQGHISITFHRENGSLKCSVEDNGVGRAKSAELNEQQGRNHKSRGMEIVKERLEIIRASNPGKYEVKIIDLADLQQNPTGTRAEITLPLEV